MKHNFNCEYKRVILKPLRLENAEKIRQLRNQPEIRSWFNYSDEISNEDQKKWVEAYLKDETDYMFEVYLKKDPNKLIGTYAAYNYDKKNGIIEAGRLMLDFKNVNEKGLGHDIVGAAVTTVFTNLPVKKIVAEIFKNNERSIKCTINGGGFIISNYEIKDGREIVNLEITRERFEHIIKEDK